MALQGSSTQSISQNSVQLSNGQTVRAVKETQNDGTPHKRLVLSGKGGARAEVTDNDCRNMKELIDWLEKA